MALKQEQDEKQEKCELLATAEDQLLLLHIKRIKAARLQLLQQANLDFKKDKKQNRMSKGLIGFVSFDVLFSLILRLIVHTFLYYFLC